MRRHAAAEIAHRLRLAEIGGGKVDRQVDRALVLEQVVPVLHGAIDHELRQRAKMRVARLRDEIGRRHHAPGRMPHPHQGLGAAAHQRARVDLGLVPQLEPAGMQGLADMHGRARRRLVRQQHRNALAQHLRAERRRQRRQHADAIFLADLPHRLDDDRVARADGEHLAGESLAHQDLEESSRLDAVGGNAEQDQVGQFGGEHVLQLVGAGAFAGDEAEVFQHLAEKGPQVALAVGHAGARRHLSPSEGHRPPSDEFTRPIVHLIPLPFRDGVINAERGFK